MNELGTPKEAARDLISNLLDRKLEEQEQVSESETTKKSSKWSLFWIACLAICAAPIGAPLAIAFLAVVLSLVICLGVIVLCIFIFAFCFFLVGAKLFIRGILAIPFSVPGFAIISGSGLFVVGLGILSIILGVALAKGIGLLFVKLAKWVSGRSKRFRKGGRIHEKMD